jgi:hypothetical protein
MLEAGRTYTFEDKTLTVAAELGKGQVALVWQGEIQDTNGTTREVAIKVPHSTDMESFLAKEAQALQTLGSYYAGWQRPPIPKDTAWVTNAYGQDGTRHKFLIMELIDARELFTVYQEMLGDAARDRYQILQAEAFAWRAALQYLGLLRNMLLRAKITSGDRKRDTFLWDERLANANQGLIVVDWNQYNRIDQPTAKDARDIIYVFAQNWYTMITRRRPQQQQFLDRLQDDGWNLSLAGRDLLLDILQGTDAGLRQSHPVAVFDHMEDRLQRILSWIENRAGLQQSYDYQRAGIVDADPPPTPSEIDTFLHIADIARRQGPPIPGAEETYNNLLTHQFTPNQGRQFKEQMRALVDPDSLRDTSVQDYFQRMLHQISNFVRDNPEPVRNYQLSLNLQIIVNAIDNLLRAQLVNNGEVVKIHENHKKLNTAVDSLRSRFNEAFRTRQLEQDLSYLMAFVNIYTLWYDINQMIVEGNTDSPVLKDKVEQMVTLCDQTSPTLLEAARINPENVQRMQAIIDDQHAEAKGPLRHIRRTFVGACQSQKTLQEFYDTYAYNLNLGAYTGDAADLVTRYLDHAATVNRLAYEPHFSEQALTRALLQFAVFLNTVPELYAWAANESPLLEAARKQYNDMQVLATAADAPLPYKLQALRFAQLLQMFYPAQEGELSA